MKKFRDASVDFANSGLVGALRKMVDLSPIFEAILFPLILLEPIILVIAAIITQAWLPVMKLLIPIMVAFIKIMLENKEIVMLVIIALMALLGGPFMALIAVILLITMIVVNWNTIMQFLADVVTKFWMVLLALISPIATIIILGWLLVKMLFGGSPGLIPAFQILYSIGMLLVKMFYTGLIIQFTIFLNIVNILIGAFKSGLSIITSVTNHINKLISSIQGILSLNPLGGGGRSRGGGGRDKGNVIEDVGNAVKKVFGYAGGGYIARPSIISVAENEGEFVFTKEQTAALASMGIGGGGGQEPIVVNINGGVIAKDFDDLAEIVGRKLRLLRG